VVMGPATCKSIGRKPLKDRFNIVLTSKHELDFTGFTFAHSIEEVLALAEAHGYSDLFVIGGAKVYASFLPIAQQLFVTEVWCDAEGDVFFPSYDQSEWREVTREPKWRKGARDQYPNRFGEYERIT
jgi:dihydrofolate reductase